MRHKFFGSKQIADKLVKRHPLQDCAPLFGLGKIRIVLAKLRGEESLAALCRREGNRCEQY